MYLQLYAFYKDGFLPYPGGIFQQDANYVQAMRIIAGEINRIDEEKLENEKKKKSSQR